MGYTPTAFRSLQPQAPSHDESAMSFPQNGPAATPVAGKHRPE